MRRAGSRAVTATRVDCGKGREPTREGRCARSHLLRSERAFPGGLERAAMASRANRPRTRRREAAKGALPACRMGQQSASYPRVAASRRNMAHRTACGPLHVDLARRQARRSGLGGASSGARHHRLNRRMRRSSSQSPRKPMALSRSAARSPRPAFCASCASLRPYSRA